MIKTFRGQLADGGQDTIRLSTNQGQIGYRIKKLQIIPEEAGDTSADLIVSVWTRKQSNVLTTGYKIDFSNSELIAVAHLSVSATYFSQDHTIIFDNTTFNQDIFVTATDNDGSDNTNYYLELEQIKLDLNEATVATLKDMRGTE